LLKKTKKNFKTLQTNPTNNLQICKCLYILGSSLVQQKQQKSQKNVREINGGRFSKHERNPKKIGRIGGFSRWNFFFLSPPVRQKAKNFDLSCLY